MLRVWRGILLFVSRWFQIESLYRFNAKFRPVWEPRFLVSPGLQDMPRVALAALEAEAFLVWPNWRCAGWPGGWAGRPPPPGSHGPAWCCSRAPAWCCSGSPAWCCSGGPAWCRSQVGRRRGWARSGRGARFAAGRRARWAGGWASWPRGGRARPAGSDGQPASGHVAAARRTDPRPEPGPAKSSPAESSYAKVSPVRRYRLFLPG